MIDRSTLQALSHEQKDELIDKLVERIEKLLKRIEDLEARLGKNSRNSSKPPSSDGLNKPAPKSRRLSGLRATGGQKGHEGNTLERRASPDQIVVHEVPTICDACQQGLPAAQVVEQGCPIKKGLTRREVNVFV